MAKAPAKANVPAVQKESKGQLPAFMQQDKKVKFGEITDLIIPRMKLIQSVSPERETYDAAVEGEFWHTIAEQSLGAEVRGVPILLRRSVVLWAPRGDDRGILARSNDCVHWAQGANEVFDVKPKSAPKQQWATKGSVAESGLTDFGTSIDGDPQSAPAASITYNILWYLLDYPALSPVAVINARSGIRPAKNLVTKVNMRDGPVYGQVFKIAPFVDGETDAQFFNYQYSADGYVDDEELYNKLKTMNEQFDQSDNWKVNDEGDEVDADKSSGGKPSGDTGGRKGKF